MSACASCSRPAQIFHLGVDEIEIVGLVDVVAPHGFGQRRLVDHMVRAAHEIIEYIVLLAQQFDLPARNFHPAAVRKQPPRFPASRLS